MSDRQTLRFQEPAAHGLPDDSFALSPTDSDRALTWHRSPSLTPTMSEDQSRTAALAEPDNGSKEPNLVFVKKELVFAALEVESTATPGSASADDAGHVQFDDMASLFSGHDASAPAAEHDDGPPPSESRREYDDVASVSSALALDPKLPLCTKCRMPTEVLISLSLSLSLSLNELCFVGAQLCLQNQADTHCCSKVHLPPVQPSGNHAEQKVPEQQCSEHVGLDTRTAFGFLEEKLNVCGSVRPPCLFADPRAD